MAKRGKYVGFTTAQWRKLGLTYGRVEWWCVQTRQLYDLFGFVDYILLVPARGVVAVQICGQDRAAHWKKILAEPRAQEWLRCGGKIDLVSWSKRKVKRGGKLALWVCRVDEITLDDFEQIGDNT